MVLFTLQEIFSFMKKDKKVEMNWPSDWFEGQMKNRKLYKAFLWIANPFVATLLEFAFPT